MSSEQPVVLKAEASGQSQVYQAGRDQHLHYGDGVRARQRAVAGAGPRDCPYPGLAPFDAEFHRWFFGRDRLVATLLDRLDGRTRTGGLQVVIAPSGAGKSSLLRAGLLPRLGQGALPGSAAWPTVVLTPGADPLWALHSALEGVTDTGERLVLVADQFEELFTLCDDPGARTAFIEELALLAARESAPDALVVIGVRADYFAACAADPRLSAALQDRPLVVEPMTETELREAIRYPAQDVGLDIEPGLVALLLRDLGVVAGADGDPPATYEPGRLPLLAHALRASWQQRQGATLTVEGYQDTGGIERAVATTADDTYEALDEAGRQTARSLFVRLVRIGDGVEDVRRRLPHDELAGGDTRPATTAAVIDAFTAARLLTRHRDTVEITHEALLRSWPRLRTWLDDDRTGRLAQQDLEDAARAWLRADREPSLLYGGKRLRTVRSWAGDRPECELSPAAHAFLTAAHRHRRRAAWLRSALAGIVVLTVVAGGYGLSWGADYRERLARRDSADQVIREHAIEFERFRKLPIRNVEVSARLSTLPQDGSAIEVRLTHDRLWSRPMSFFITPVRDGADWPKQLGIRDDDQNAFPCQHSEMSGRLRWYDRDEPMITTLPLVGDPWGYVTTEFTGKEFKPLSALSVPQKHELAPIETLVAKDATVELFLHRPGQPKPEKLDPDHTSVQVEVAAAYEGAVWTRYTLFRSVHTPVQREAMGVDALYHRPLMEQEALLSSYEPAATVQGVRAVKPAEDRWRQGASPSSPAEEALFAAFENNAGVLTRKPAAAVRHYENAVRLGTTAATQIATDNASVPGRAGLCAATYAALNLTDLLKPGVDSKLATLQASVTRLSQVPAPYRESVQVRRWLSMTFLRFATGFGERQDRPKSMLATRYAMDEAGAAYRGQRTIAGALEFIEASDTAGAIRARLSPPESGRPEWSDTLRQACTQAVEPWRQAAPRGSLPEELRSCA
ncbi:hypothetical protein AB0368_34405 [Actinoplanes sp. NPDC051475]|uniref:nSTAND1 domain-containing NTPase n=1 Tax=Actinoplanes sp. NPDC051475 TaxID=3157225 RepID=UPI00344D1793